MNIIITGAGGQLGHDCADLLKSRHLVKGYTSSQLDITQYDQVLGATGQGKPEVIINCAAYTAVDNCEKDEVGCSAVNHQGPRNLAKACQAHDCKLIHISTDYVFDGNKPVPQAYSEEDPVSPLSAYGRSKLAGEQAIARETDNYLILRTAWLYGFQGNNFLKTMLRLALADPDRTIRVVDDQHGSLTWTMSLARQIEALLNTDITGIAHATAHNATTWFKGAEYFLETMGVDFSLEPCTTQEYPTPAHRPQNSILANERLLHCKIDVMQAWHKDVDDFVSLYKDQLIKELAP